MPASVIEFVFFKIRPDVKPEDPKSNEDGESLLKLFNDTRLQHGYLAGAWGRTIEDTDFIVWVISWSDARGASRAALLIPYLQPQTEVLTMYTTLMPNLDIRELCANPITELCPMTFPTSLTPDEHNKLNQALVNTRIAALKEIPQEVQPRNWWMGHVDRPGKREHPTSPSGEAFVVFILVGWESVEAHKKARETEAYRRHRDEIKGRLLPTGTRLLPGTGLGMTHAKFVEI